MPSSHSRLRIALAFACIYVVWGTTYFGIAIALRELPPFISCAVRFSLAATILYGYLRWRNPRPLAGLPTGMVILTGALMCGMGNGFTVLAQRGVPSGIAALLNSAIPICVTVLDWLWFTRRRPGGIAAIGLAVGIGGVTLIVTRTGSFTGLAGLGYFLAMVAGVTSWSLGTLLQRGKVTPDRLLALACGQMAAGAAFHCLAATADGEWARLDPATVSMNAWGAVLYLALAGSVLTQSTYLWLLSEFPAGQVTTYALVNPVVAMLLGVLFLAEPVGGIELAGAALVLGGVSMVLFQGVVARWFAALRRA